MINDALIQLDAERAVAIGKAEAVLCKHGFSLAGERQWQGMLDGGDHGPIPVVVTLPPTFPDALPAIRVDRAALPRRMPHVEKDGKVCIGPNTGLLLDASNPSGLMTEALLRAQGEIIAGLSGANAQHFIDEFIAYWGHGASRSILSTCTPDERSRPVYEVCLAEDGLGQPEQMLLADSFDAAKTWAANARRRIQYGRPAFFIELEQPFMPPNFDATFTVGDMLKIIQASTPHGYHAFLTWLKKHKLPAVVLLSMPLPVGQGHVLAAVRFERATAAAATHMQRGFRPGKVPVKRELSCTYHTSITRLLVDRRDAAYLLARGGAAEQLFTRTITVVGCGAVGSHVVERLAALGVGHFRLVDPERLGPENVQRHVLGVASIGVHKATGLKQEIGRRFPHLTIEARTDSIEDVLRKESQFVLDADLIIVAVGDETIELRLNKLLRGTQPRLHVWIEPLGIGGHVLATGVATGPGCFQCIFATDPEFGLYNRAAFAAPGQRFQRSYAGCAGVFTPFASIDADRAAIETATLASRILLDQETENVLLSWRGDPTAFLDAGFRLSPRAQMMAVGEQRRVTEYTDHHCSGCELQSHAISAAA